MTVCVSLTELKVNQALSGARSLDMQAGSIRMAGTSSKCTRVKHPPGRQWLGLQTGYPEMATLIFVLVMMTKRTCKYCDV